ncbi:MAG TPA: outer membrane beta-barrel protein [Polyangiaceae bacterium]|nr:outer membrane beta-barrel protein [Polyangiaceae bacterium]
MTPGWLLALAVPVTMVCMAMPARAADDAPGCPPGEWFCDDGGEEAPPPVSSEPSPDVDVDEDAGERPEFVPDDGGMDVTRPAPGQRIEDRGWSEGSGARASSPWSLALRVEGALLGGKRHDTRLGGLGVSGRYSLGPVVTLDLGLDSILGTDYNGNDRSELTLSLSSLFYLNYNPVLRSYVLVGLNTSRARVDVLGDAQTWGYFGGHTGIGFEIALDPRVALNFDLLGFMRGRTDSRAASEPEFTDAQGRVTNTSGGGLLRGGINLRF